MGVSSVYVEERIYIILRMVEIKEIIKLGDKVLVRRWKRC